MLSKLRYLAMVLFIVLSPAAAQACNVLVGDSLGQGLAPFAQRDGFRANAHKGAGIAWLRNVVMPCAPDRVILMFGTNDLLGIRTEADAIAYANRIIEITSRWRARQVTWATPGCITGRPDFERGSRLLSAALQTIQSPVLIDDGRRTRCHFTSHDGIHTTGRTYGEWWANLRG